MRPTPLSKSYQTSMASVEVQDMSDLGPHSTVARTIG
jgi:hypothetical protein